MQTHRADSTGNPPALEIAIIALAIAQNALGGMSENIEPGPCTCKQEGQSRRSWYCRSCELWCLLDDAVGQEYAMRTFLGLLECQTRGMTRTIRQLTDYLDGNWVEWPAPDHLAEVLLQLAAGCAAGADLEADPPAVVVAGPK